MASHDSSSNPAGPRRLDRSVIPTRYELTLAPDLEKATFEGSEEISIDVLGRIEAIVLNSAELHIHSAWIADTGGRRAAVSGIETDESNEQARLALSEALAEGSYRLHIDFAGSLNDKLRGFYRSRYEDASGHTRIIAATQFESTEARRAFPCFDEPDLKAVFAVTLIVGQDLLAASNSPIISDTTDSHGARTVRFSDTMKMSTYLVAFIVGSLEASDPLDVDGVPLRVLHPIGQGRLAKHALEVATFSLRFFSEYYAIPYPGQKLDLVALPDFAMGAMENLGCVTFRESLLLVDPEAVTQGELERSAEVIAHELAHMWFGDLVTMRWWNGIWLNEAFATFMANKALEAYKPEWQPWVQFSLGRAAAFEVDALESSRPIEYPVESPADAEGMFDVLTYQKGAAVLRMLEQYLGEDSFRQGIRGYLARHSYGNTETQDLWAALEAATKEPVERIMTSWIYQRGFPRVRVERAHEDRISGADGRGAALRLAQEQYRLGRWTAAGRDEEPRRWVIPLLFRVGSTDKGDGRARRVLMDGAKLDLALKAAPGYAVVNAESAGYYRVAYDDELSAELSERMFEVLAPVERFVLLDDAWSMVLAGERNAGGFLELAVRFSPENDVNVWKTLAGSLGHLTRLVEAEPLERLRGIISRLVGSPLERIGWSPSEGEPERVRQLRGLLVETLCVAGRNETARAQARAIWGRSLSDPASVEPNLAAAAVAAVASIGEKEDYERFVKLSKSATTPQERLRYLYALAAFPGLEEVDRTLAMTLSGEVRTQNAPFLLGSALANRYHGERAWAFVRDNWERINSAFPSNTIVRMLGGVRAFSRRAIGSEVEAFFSEHAVPQGQITLRQHLELMRVNVELREREESRFSAELLRGEQIPIGESSP